MFLPPISNWLLKLLILGVILLALAVLPDNSPDSPTNKWIERAEKEMEIQRRERVRELVEQGKARAAFDAKPGPKLTKEAYRQLKEGMPYEEVVAIIGPPAEETQKNAFSIGDRQTIDHTTYRWVGGGRGHQVDYAHLTFWDGELTQMRGRFQ